MNARDKEVEKEAKKKAEAIAKENARKEAEEAKARAKKEAEETARAKEAAKIAKKKAEAEAREKARLEAEEAARQKEAEEGSLYLESELFDGQVRLEINSSSGYELVEQFKKGLREIDNLRITLDSWSEEEGIIIVVSLKEPMLLGNILQQMKSVEQVYRSRKKVVVVLK